MNYNSVHSLQHLCVIRLATALCTQNEARKILGEFNMGCYKYSEEMKKKITEKVSKLFLPQSLMNQVLDALISVSLKIFHLERCLLRYMTHCRFILKRLQNFQQDSHLYKLWWTSLGVIDKKRTIQLLIRDERLPVKTRYKLACMYCLEDDILHLWNKIPYQDQFYRGENAIEVKDMDLAIFWTYLHKGEITKLNNVIQRQSSNCTPYQFALEYSACTGNKVAIEYFLQKLPPEEQDKLLVKCANYVSNSRYHIVNKGIFPCQECYSESLRFLLSRMNEVQQMEVFRLYPHQVLKSFLDWPWHNFFIPTAEFVLSFLSEKVCKKLLQNLVSKVQIGYKNCGYERLFADFWQIMPESHKRYIIDDKYSFDNVLKPLFMVEDRENIKVLLEYATSKDRKAIIFSTVGTSICFDLCYRFKIDLLKFFIKQCIPSKAVIDDLKHLFRDRLNTSYPDSFREVISNRIQQTLDCVSQEMDERNLEDASISAKKFCIASD